MYVNTSNFLGIGLGMKYVIKHFIIVSISNNHFLLISIKISKDFLQYHWNERNSCTYLLRANRN